VPLTIQAQNNETPDSTQALTSAVTGNSNTGHSNTNSTVEVGPDESNSQTKTCRWFNFPGALVTKTKLQFSWSLSGSLTLTGALPGTTVAHGIFEVEYSINGGASWNSAVSRTFTQNVNGTQPLSDSGSVDIDIVTTDPAQVQVRDRVRADASSAIDPTVSASASITAEIHTLQLEVDLYIHAPICIF
jgi:hypothetical protein